MKSSNTEKVIIGRLENISLPELGIDNLTVRVDSGAQTSSLHVDHIKLIKVNGKPGIQFDIHPEVHDVDKVVRCKSELYDLRKIKSSNGMSEQRYVIETMAKCQTLEAAWKGRAVQTLIETFPKGQALQATGQSHIIHVLVETVSKK